MRDVVRPSFAWSGLGSSGVVFGLEGRCPVDGLVAPFVFVACGDISGEVPFLSFVLCDPVVNFQFLEEGFGFVRTTSYKVWPWFNVFVVLRSLLRDCKLWRLTVCVTGVGVAVLFLFADVRWVLRCRNRSVLFVGVFSRADASSWGSDDHAYHLSLRFTYSVFELDRECPSCAAV